MTAYRVHPSPPHLHPGRPRSRLGPEGATLARAPSGVRAPSRRAALARGSAHPRPSPARRLAWAVALALPGLIAACASPSSTPATEPTGAAEPAARPAAPDIDWALSPAHIRTSCSAAIERAQGRVRALAGSPQAGAGPRGLAALRAIEAAVAEMREALIAQRLLASVVDDEAVREASGACRTELAAFRVALAADPAVYALAQAARAEATDPVDAKLAVIYLERGRDAGAALDPDARATVKALFDELDALEMAYMRKMGEPVSIEISAAEAASLPPPFVRTLEREGDGYLVPVHYGTRDRFLTTQASGDARRRYLHAFLSRGGQANVERLEQALALRDRIAHLLGFESWAAYKLAPRMARTPARAMALLDEVTTRLLPHARREIAALAALKAAGGDPTPFAAWDYHYYLERFFQAEFGVDGETVRQYFPVDRFVPAVLALYERLLGVRYRPLPSAPTWHPDARAYAILDRDGRETLGFFFLDLAPRPSKSLHFAHFRLRAGRALPGGGYQRPMAAVIGNGPPAEPGKPSLLGHNDAIIFFHEFGHLMHDTLSRARYATLYGTNVRRDFAEAPSQMFENWMWQPSVLARVSSHVDTGEPLPAPLIAQMVALDRADTGAFWTRQAFFSVYDLTMHASGPDVDTTALWFQLAAERTALPQPPEAIPQSTFAGFMGGYDAGYYGYIWSKVFAQDMFSAFLEEGLDDPAVGLRYRRTVLEPGGTREPDELLRDFLGRPVRTDAFYHTLGLDAER